MKPTSDDMEVLAENMREKLKLYGMRCETCAKYEDCRGIYGDYYADFWCTDWEWRNNG